MVFGVGNLHVSQSVTCVTALSEICDIIIQ